jgi:hypothetical protein
MFALQRFKLGQHVTLKAANPLSTVLMLVIFVGARVFLVAAFSWTPADLRDPLSPAFLRTPASNGFQCRAEATDLPRCGSGCCLFVRQKTAEFRCVPYDQFGPPLPKPLNPVNSTLRLR